MLCQKTFLRYYKTLFYLFMIFFLLSSIKSIEREFINLTYFFREFYVYKKKREVIILEEYDRMLGSKQSC
jgi:hypothetical protein